MKTLKFENYDLSPEILKALGILGYDHPTEVQAKVVPLLLEGKDVIVKSQTGSGKTAAFGIPLSERVVWEENRPQVLVITPTRELAVQVKEDIFHVGRFKRLKVVSLYGKAPFHLQAKQLKQKTHVVVGTPGRILDHLSQGTLDFSMIRYLVVDEADEMLKMGFIDQIDDIIAQLPKERVTALLSATFPTHIERLCKDYMISPTQVVVESTSPVHERIEQVLMKMAGREKLGALRKILAKENPTSAMIFCNMQATVEALYEEILAMNMTAGRIHGGMEQRDRLSVMDSFRDAAFSILVATDVASRGIDIDDIQLVINYDVPNHKDSYVHRIGRTGRIGNLGKAITLASPEEERDLLAIEAYIGRSIPLANEEREGDAETEAEIQVAPHAQDQGEVQDQDQAPQPLKVTKRDKKQMLNADILQLHIKGGKKTKMRPVDVVGGLCSIPDITAEDIGIINILDVSTYVEILNGKGRYVIDQLKHIPIKGRIREVNISRKSD